MSEQLLEVRNLTKTYAVGGGQRLVAVNDVDLDLAAGETLGLVGESGSGKTTLGRCLLRLVEPDSGTVRFAGTNLLALDREPMRRARSNMQIVYQDPMSAFNPRMTVNDIVAEPLRLHVPGTNTSNRVEELLRMVGLNPDVKRARPARLEKGEQQLVAIARAIATKPRLLILDEPTGLLDLSVRVAVLASLEALQREHGFSYVFISHDLNAVRAICHRLAIMYLGKIVESGPSDRVFADPMHPYSRALLSSVLRPVPSNDRARLRLAGEIPSPINLPPGCALASRCPMAEAVCRETSPPVVRLQGEEAPTWWATCHPLSRLPRAEWRRRMLQAETTALQQGAHELTASRS